MKVAVFRAAADGERTAAKLQSFGYEAVLAPVIEIVPTGVELPADGTACVFTSAHAVDVLVGDPGRADWTTRPCFCVGDRTAEAARSMGFGDIRNAQGRAENLADLIAHHLSQSAELVLVTAPDRKPDLEVRLKSAGFRLRTVEVYEAVLCTAWSGTLIENLADDALGAALHYSRRSATQAIRMVAASGLSDRFASWQHVAMSNDVAAPLRQMGIDRIRVATRPDERHLLATLP